MIDDAKEHFDKILEKLEPVAASRRVTLETEVEVGHPAEQLVLAAERQHTDAASLRGIP